jgi:hypothetical protein
MAYCPVENKLRLRKLYLARPRSKKNHLSFDPEDIPQPLTPALPRIKSYLIVLLKLLLRPKRAAPF